MSYWYNVASGQVETDDDRSRADDVMGPYDSREAAENALKSAHDRTDKWDAEDREWDSKGSADS